VDVTLSGSGNLGEDLQRGPFLLWFLKLHYIVGQAQFVPQLGRFQKIASMSLVA
jgi:hypothetical protein